MTTERIIELECKIAEQELTCSKLSEEVYHQHIRIEKLERQLESLVEHLKGGQPEQSQEVPIDRPPHY